MIDPESMIRAICTRCGISAPDAHRQASNNNYVYALNESLIAKFPKEKERTYIVREEAEICKSLCRLGLPVPEVLDVIDAEDTVCVLYSRFPGVTIEQLGQTQPGHWRACGEFLVNLFETRQITCNVGSGECSFDWRGLEKSLHEYGLLDDELTTAMEDMKLVYEQDDLMSFSHADYGPGQTLFDPHRHLCVIDWERSGIGNPLYSAGRFCAMIAEYIDGPKHQFISAFASGFCTGQFHGSDDQIALMQSFSDLRDIQWKLVSGVDNNAHALLLIDKVRGRLGLTSRCSGRDVARH